LNGRWIIILLILKIEKKAGYPTPQGTGYEPKGWEGLTRERHLERGVKELKGGFGIRAFSRCVCWQRGGQLKDMTLHKERDYFFN